MKTLICVAFLALVSSALHSQSFNSDGSFTVSSEQSTPSTITSVEMDFNIDEAFPIKTEKINEWGIKGTVSTEGYIKLRIMYNGYYLGAIKNEPNGASNFYYHKPWYYDCGGWLYWIERRDWALTESPCANPNWKSDDLKASLAYIEGIKLRPETTYLSPSTFPIYTEEVPRAKTIKVTLVLEVKNAIVNEIYIPGLGKPKTPRMLFERDRKGVVVYVEREDNDTRSKRYDFTVPVDQLLSPNTETISLTAGDRVTYEVYGNTNVTKEPIIQGVPKIWASGYAAQREFITTPDYGPNQYHPWIGYEAQTHFRLINSYPKEFKKTGIKTNGWKVRAKTKTWEWVAQRRTDTTKLKYNPVIYYPKTKKFIMNDEGKYKYQRESQALGWSKQMMEYYDKFESNTLGNEKYLTGFDVDEYLYVGSKNPDATVVNDWKNQADTTYNPNILSIHNYQVPVFNASGVKFETSNNNNWQNLWESEKSYAVSSSDIVINNIPEKNEYPLVWGPERRLPKFGFLLNDMITRYQKYKSTHDGDPNTNLSDGYYYNGYEIQDVASHKNGTGATATALTREANGNPKPCAEDCWYVGNEGGENVKHLGQVKITIPTTKGDFIVNFKQQVDVPIDNEHNTHKGFYSSLQAEHGQYTMGYGNKNTWTLHGVEEAYKDRISLVMLEYNAGKGMMIPTSVKKLKKTNDPADDTTEKIKYSTYDSSAKTISASFEVYSGWVAIAAYYKTKNLKDSVIIAGRVPMVMDPPTSLTVPGSDPLPYSATSLAINEVNAIDLKEGQGDRAFETMNEIRNTIDPGKGYINKLGDAYTKYVREYHVIKENKLNFSCIDVGRKIQTFWDNGSEDPYQSWRELAKRMPSDAAREKLEWSVYEMNADGAAPTKIGTSTYTRHFNYKFNKVGTYEVWVTWKDAPKFTPTKVLVHVKEDPGNYTTLSNEIERGKINTRLLTLEEKRWLKEHTKNLDGTPLASAISVELNNLEAYVVAEVDEILSEYTYRLGPRASEETHREGLRKDFNEQFQWFHDENELTLPYFIKLNFLGKQEDGTYNDIYDQNLLVWPETWDKIWLYHNPRKGKIAPVTSLEGVIRDGDEDITAFNNTMDNVFPKLNEAQSALPWMRWFPWIAISPTNGYKINRYIKTTLNLPKFLSNESGHSNGKGLFSGKAKTKVYEISNAIENMMWFDYGSPKASLVSDKELDRHLSDDKKNLLEFYNDLKYGRKIIFNPGAVGSPSNGDQIIVKNINPKKFTEDNLKTEQIYIASTILENFANSSNSLPGIPLLTFNDARAGRTLLNSKYTITGGEASIVNKGGNKYLKIVATSWENKDIEIKVNIPESLFDESSKGIGVRIADVPQMYGFKVSLAHEANSDVTFSFNVYNTDGTIPMLQDNKTIKNSSLTAVSVTNMPSTYAVPPKSIVIKISKQNNTGLIDPIIYLDDLTLIDREELEENQFFDMANSNDTAITKWLAESSYRFFDWNYKEIGDTGVFLEEAGEDKVSLSGQGMGIAVTILAEKAGYLKPQVARDRIDKVLNWLKDVQILAYNTTNQEHTGWHGMPSHYFNSKGSIYNPVTEDYPDGAVYPLAVSTIDWVIAAQGIRLARQYYSNDDAIKTLTTSLLIGVDWSKFVMPTKGKNGKLLREENGDLLHNGGRIVFDVNPKTGEINTKGNAWGQDFSEETELVYLEVLASSHEKKTGESQHTNLPFTNMNDINKVIYIDKTKKVVAGVEVITERAVKIIDRKCKNGFIPSYFGSGFTYNWLQLWYGSRKLSSTSYTSWGLWSTNYWNNSQKAYRADYQTANNRFLNKPYMGLTAASTVSSIASNGFVKYGEYLSNQGSNVNLAPQGQVVQVAPAPYGAVLALPFEKTKAMEAIRAYIDLGFYHEYMGFPDNVVLEGTGALGPMPNWNQLDINIAPIAMAIDQSDFGQKFLANSLVSDIYAMKALYALYTSFSNDSSCTIPSNKVTNEEKPLEVVIEEFKEPKESILLYPNPNSGKFTIRFTLNNPGIYEGAFKDLQGRIIAQGKWEFENSGSHEVILEGLSNQKLSSGLYIMAIKGTSINKTIPVMIENE